MDEQITESSADASPVAENPSVPAHLASAANADSAENGVEPGRRRRRWLLPLLLAPLVLLIIATIAWAVDTSSGSVARNVKLGSDDVGGLSEAELASRLTRMADTFADTPVEITSGDDTYATTAGDIGLLIDEARTAEQVLDVGTDTFVLLRPLDWMRSFVVERDTSLVFLVNDDQVTSATVTLEGDDRVPPTEPTVELVDGSFEVVRGVDGRGLDSSAVSAALPAAASATSLDETIRIEVERVPLPPVGRDDDARAAASRAEALVSEPVELQTAGGNRVVEPEQLRSWVTLASQPDGSVEVDLDPGRVTGDLRGVFADIDGRPVDARFTLEGGTPVIIPDQPGTVCCAADSAQRIIDALRAGTRTVQLDLIEGQADFTAADAEAWGITQPVGGNHAWRDGAPTTAEPGFTTYHGAGGNRVINIHRIADLVRGTVVPPGATFSVNDHVGRRTAANGFVAAGAIANGQHVDEIGGGISQFATTLFNAAYFAGLDIGTYQAHSEYFKRYPYGREATMGFPAPDLQFTNNTPYGILIWTSYTSTSLTITLYSSPFATAEQTGISESMSGNCKVVVTTRTRTFTDGRTENDTFRARYRPGAGLTC